MKECIKVKRLLSRYLDKETGAADTVLIETHTDVCCACKRELLELSRIKELVAGKEKKALPQDYLVFRLREKIVRKRYREGGFSFTGMGSLSRRLIPVPVAAIALSVTFLFLASAGRAVNGTSLEDTILSGTSVTTDAALGLILGARD